MLLRRRRRVIVTSPPTLCQPIHDGPIRLDMCCRQHMSVPRCRMAKRARRRFSPRYRRKAAEMTRRFPLFPKDLYMVKLMIIIHFLDRAFIIVRGCADTIKHAHGKRLCSPNWLHRIMPTNKGHLQHIRLAYRQQRTRNRGWLA